MTPPRLRLSRPVHPPLLSPDSGPGRRWLVYVQGCRNPCTKVCLNPELLDAGGGVDVPFDDAVLVVDLIAAGRYGPVEGLTVLGGEPTDQAEALLPLLLQVRSVGLSVMLYSGRTRAWFDEPQNAAARRLLEATDILVAEPFLPALARPGLRWRGSTNQTITRLTDRYSEADLEAGMRAHGMTVSVTSLGEVVVTGLQSRATAEHVERALREDDGEPPA